MNMFEFFASVFNFVVVLAILWKFALPSARQFLTDRSDGISTEMKESKTLFETASVALNKWQKAWTDSIEHVDQARKEAEASLKIFRDETMASAKSQSERIVSEGELLAQGEVAKANRAIRNEVVENSFQLASQYLGSSLKEEDRNMLVKDYLESVHNGSV